MYLHSNVRDIEAKFGLTNCLGLIKRESELQSFLFSTIGAKWMLNLVLLCCLTVPIVSGNILKNIYCPPFFILLKAYYYFHPLTASKMYFRDDGKSKRCDFCLWRM